jgi:UDP-2,3-diacylglucosamine pyrophosphatase LpxH
MPYWSLSAYLKLKVKKAVNFISDFEVAVANEARKLGYHGVVCGHIHHAEIRNIDGMLYCNDGDWVESCSALVEHADGRLEILKFNPNGNLQNAENVKAMPAVVTAEADKWVAA